MVLLCGVGLTRHTYPVPAQHNPPSQLPGSEDDLFTNISCTVYAAYRHTVPSGRRLPPSTLPHYRIFVGLAGSATFVVAGKPYSLVPGGVILISPGATHHARPTPRVPLSATCIDFDAKLHGILDVPEFCGLPVSLMPRGVLRRKIISCASTIVRLAAFQRPGYRFGLHSQCLRLLNMLHHEAISRTHSNDTLGPLVRPTALHRFRPVFQLVERRFRDRLTLADLAAAVHLQPAYFSVTFKRAAGLGPHECVSRYRLARASELLLASDTALHEIARHTGFYDAAHLVRLFRRYQGTSPGRYRRLHSAPPRTANQ